MAFISCAAKGPPMTTTPTSGAADLRATFSEMLVDLPNTEPFTLFKAGFDAALAAGQATAAQAVVLDDVAALVRAAQAFVLEPDSHKKKLELEAMAWGPLAAATQPAPVLWLSPEQFANFMDTDEAPFGKYIPARKTSAGKFTMPLFAALAPAQPVAEPAGAVSEMVKFTDQSTANPIEKARRYLAHVANKKPNNPYFFDDGYPRESIADDAAAALSVLEQLAASRGQAPAGTTEPTEQQILEAAEKAGLWPNTVHSWIPAFHRYHKELAKAQPAPAQAAEPVAVVVPCYTPSGKRVALCSAKQDLPIGTKLYAAPQPSPTAPATQQPEGDVVAYLDVGANGYLDLGSELSEDALQQLPKGRHALVIAGTYGIDGYVAAPQPSYTAQAADSVQEDAARYRWLREGNDAKHGAAWHVAVNLYGCEWDAAIDAARARLEGKP